MSFSPKILDGDKKIMLKIKDKPPVTAAAAGSLDDSPTTLNKKHYSRDKSMLQQFGVAVSSRKGCIRDEEGLPN